MEATHKQKEFLHHNVAFLLVWISGSESSKRVSTNDSACYILTFYHFFCSTDDIKLYINIWSRCERGLRLCCPCNKFSLLVPSLSYTYGLVAQVLRSSDLCLLTSIVCVCGGGCMLYVQVFKEFIFLIFFISLFF